MTSPRFKLYYWPLPFRGCFASYLMAYHQVPFIEETSFDEIQKLRELPTDMQKIPFMGPPLLHDFKFDRTLSQMPAIISYLSRELNLLPANSYEIALETKVLMDCNDLLMEICRYNGSMMWVREEWIDFRTKRFPKWMKVFEEMVNRGFLATSEVNVADICTYALFGNMIRCLPDLEEDLDKNAPKVKSLCKKIETHTPLKEFVLGQTKKYENLYCGGQIEKSIRHMLELDKTGTYV